MPQNIKVIVSTPRGKVYTYQTKNGKVKAKLEWNENIQRFNSQYSRAQAWLDKAVLKDSTPFVPMLSGALFKSGILGTVLGSGLVAWIAPYARRQYYGKVIKGPKYGPKYRTEKDLTYSKSAHGLAQSHWFEAAKSLNKTAWINGARRIAGGGK